MNLISVALALALFIGILQYDVSSNPLVFTLLSILLLVHLSNHVWLDKKVIEAEKAAAKTKKPGH